MLPLVTLRLAVLASVAVAVAAAVVVAAPAAAHMAPDQHRAQLRSVSVLEAAAATFSGKAAVASASCQNGMAGPYPCKDVDLESFVALPTLGGATGNDIWGWEDAETKRKYALIGTSTSTGFVDVTDSKNPVLVGTLPTRGTPDLVLWRDIKVDGDFAFIVSEISRSGLQVFDLKRLRGRTTPTVFTADATYDGFSRAHNIVINPETDTAYAVGVGDATGASRTGEAGTSNECTNGKEGGGMHMIDIADPLKPTFAGCALVPDADGSTATESNNYVHDTECVVYDGPDTDYTGREICFGSNENAVVIYDVTDKASPKVLSVTTYPTASYTHQGSLTQNGRFFLFGDELDEQERSLGTTTYIMDVADLDAPLAPKAFTAPTSSIDHNLYVAGNRAFQSNYTAGLRIVEFDDASLAAGRLEEVAFFDVVPSVDIAEFAGTWSNFRFSDGTVVVSAIENEVNGLFVLRPTLPADDAPATGGGGDAGQAPDRPGEQPQTKPQTPQQQQQGQAQGGQGQGQGQGQSQAVAGSSEQRRPSCIEAPTFRSADAQPRGRRVGFTFERQEPRPVQVDVFQTSIGRRVIGERLVARFTGRDEDFVWNGKANRRGREVRDGYYFVRFRTVGSDGRTDTRRDTLRRVGGKWSERPAFYRRASCGLVTSFKLERPVFGGRTNRAVLASYRLAQSGRVTIDVLRGDKLVKRFRSADRRGGITYRVRFDAEGRARGDYRFRIGVVRDGTRTTATLTSRRL